MEGSGRRRLLKREVILETAIRLFSKHGAKRVSIEEICREAKVSKATFYKNFRNKVELVHRIHDDLVDEGFRKFDEIDALDLPFEQKIDLMGQWKVEFARRINAEFFRELIDVDHAVDEYKRRYLSNLEAAQKRGDIRRDIDLNFLWLALEKIGELFREDQWKTVCSDLGELQRQVRTLIWHGLLTRPPDEEKEDT